MPIPDASSWSSISRLDMSTMVPSSAFHPSAQ